MQAIEVKWLPATDTLGARLKATACGGSVTIPRSNRDYDYDSYVAAVALCNKLEWPDFDKLIRGALPNGNDAWVFGK